LGAAEHTNAYLEASLHLCEKCQFPRKPGAWCSRRRTRNSKIAPAPNHAMSIPPHREKNPRHSRLPTPNGPLQERHGRLA
jgi:hypothetical protein